jgi:hypothetical protein
MYKCATQLKRIQSCAAWYIKKQKLTFLMAKDRISETVAVPIKLIHNIAEEFLD